VRDKYTQLIRIESNIAALKKSIDQSQIPTYLKISIAPRVSQDYQESLDKVVKEGILSLQKQVMNAMLDARNLERERIQSHIADDMNERKEKVDDLINIYLENGIPIPKSFVSEANANFEKKAKEIYLSLKTQAITRKNTLAEKAERKKTAEAENNIQRILQQPENSNNNRNGTVSATQPKPANNQPAGGGKKDEAPTKEGAQEKEPSKPPTRGRGGRNGRGRGRGRGRNRAQ